MALSNDSPVCRCDDRVPKTWKLFVEDESLVPLGEALYYLAASKLGNYDVCIEHRVELALKLQLRQVDSLKLLTRVDTIWKNRDSKTLKRFVNMKCRQKWWHFDGKVLLDETAVTEFQINRHREDNQQTENATESPVSRLLPGNIDEHCDGLKSTCLGAGKKAGGKKAGGKEADGKWEKNEEMH